MPLHTPPVYLADANANLTSTPSLTPGTTVTGGAANTKGVWAQLVAATAFDSAWIVVGISNVHTAATDTRTLVDIGIGANPNETAIISNLLAGQAPNFTYTAGNIARTYVIPFYIPRGTRISARLQSVVASKAARVNIAVIGGPSAPERAFRGCDTYGVTTASSSGVAITPGNTGAQSSYVSVGSTTTRPYGAVFMGLQSSLTVITQIAYQFQIGVSSSPIPSAGAEFMWAGDAGEAIGGPWPPTPLFVDIPSGSQLQVRGKASGTAVAHETALYCLY